MNILLTSFKELIQKFKLQHDWTKLTTLHPSDNTAYIEVCGHEFKYVTDLSLVTGELIIVMHEEATSDCDAEVYPIHSVIDGQLMICKEIDPATQDIMTEHERGAFEAILMTNTGQVLISEFQKLE